MHFKFIILLNLLLLAFIIFLGRELYQAEQEAFQIFGEKNFSLVKTNQKLWTLGDSQTDRAKALTGAVSPYFLKSEISEIKSLPSAKKYLKKDTSVMRLSDHITRIEFQGQTIFCIESNIEEEEFLKIKKLPVAFDSDFWILSGHDFPDFFPPPKKAVLFLKDRKPAQKLAHFIRDHKIPFLSARETGGFWLDFDEGNWRLRVRNLNS